MHVHVYRREANEDRTVPVAVTEPKVPKSEKEHEKHENASGTPDLSLSLYIYIYPLSQIE